MRILVLSDTHGNQAAVCRAREAAGRIDAVIHLGDGERDAALFSFEEQLPVVRVAGNCDLGSPAPRELLCEWQGVRLLLCHGDRYGVKAGMSRLVEHGLQQGAAAVLYGHTHHAQVEQQQGIWLINPGTLTAQSSEHSYAILELVDREIRATIFPLD